MECFYRVLYEGVVQGYATTPEMADDIKCMLWEWYADDDVWIEEKQGDVWVKMT